MDVEVQLFDALNARDSDAFIVLFVKYPEYLYEEDGHCKWLHIAARDGLLPIVKFLVEEMGVDVNNPVGEVQPEGPISNAAQKGRFEIVQYLLEQGAIINNVISPEIQAKLDEGDDGTPSGRAYKSKVRCMPLTAAASGNHLDVVKLLVKHGADLNANWAGMNALTFAKGEVKEYLESVGMKPMSKD